MQYEIMPQKAIIICTGSIGVRLDGYSGMRMRDEGFNGGFGDLELERGIVNSREWWSLNIALPDSAATRS